MTDTIIPNLQSLQNELKTQILDFKDPEVLKQTRDIADSIITTGLSYEEAIRLEHDTTSGEKKTEFSNLIHLAIKLVKSRLSILKMPAFHASIILPAYGENIRMMKRGAGYGEDPNGENFVLEKSKQLQWLFKDSKSSFETIIVDDMSKPDPITSGQDALNIISANSVENFRVLFLEDGVNTEKLGDTLVSKSLKGVEFPKNTRKAGAVYYGMAKAIQEYAGKVPHVIVLTDCDLSVDIGQLGILVEPIISEHKAAVAGSRRLPESILEIGGSRNTRANAARYFRELLLKGLLPRDTQCGAKAFRADAISDIISSGVEILDFSFDIEMLTKIAVRFGAEQIKAVPVAWFDSSELTTTDSSVHFTIMQAQLKMAQSLQTGHGEAFDKTVALSQRLTSDESVWINFLEQLGKHEDLLREITEFNPETLSKLEKLIE